MAKLLRKDVLKWIRKLSDGSYKKGKGRLVSVNGTKFCCLGVWADMQGCTWEEQNHNSWDGTVLIPIAKGSVKANKKQNHTFVSDPKLTKGLRKDAQSALASINDDTRGFKSVIKYIKENILPEAK